MRAEEEVESGTDRNQQMCTATRRVKKQERPPPENAWRNCSPENTLIEDLTLQKCRRNYFCAFKAINQLHEPLNTDNLLPEVTAVGPAGARTKGKEHGNEQALRPSTSAGSLATQVCIYSVSIQTKEFLKNYGKIMPSAIAWGLWVRSLITFESFQFSDPF